MFADHKWSAEQSLENTALEFRQQSTRRINIANQIEWKTEKSLFSVLFFHTLVFYWINNNSNNKKDQKQYWNVFLCFNLKNH